MVEFYISKNLDALVDKYFDHYKHNRGITDRLEICDELEENFAAWIVEKFDREFTPS